MLTRKQQHCFAEQLTADSLSLSYTHTHTQNQHVWLCSRPISITSCLLLVLDCYHLLESWSLVSCQLKRASVDRTKSRSVDLVRFKVRPDKTTDGKNHCWVVADTHWTGGTSCRGQQQSFGGHGGGGWGEIRLLFCIHILQWGKNDWPKCILSTYLCMRYAVYKTPCMIPGLNIVKSICQKMNLTVTVHQHSNINSSNYSEWGAQGNHLDFHTALKLSRKTLTNFYCLRCKLVVLTLTVGVTICSCTSWQNVTQLSQSGKCSWYQGSDQKHADCRNSQKQR